MSEKRPPFRVQVYATYPMPAKVRHLPLPHKLGYLPPYLTQTLPGTRGDAVPASQQTPHSPRET